MTLSFEVGASNEWAGEGSSSVGKKWDYLQKKEFSLKLKNNVSGGSSEPIEVLFIFWRGFGWF